MLRPLVVTLVALGVAAGAVLVLKARDSEPSRVGDVTLVGDSLNVGTAPYLAAHLDGWTLRDDSVVGRGTDDGLTALAALPGHDPVVISLGTNDPRGSAAAFAQDVERALDVAGRGRCLVWATIWRDGGPDEELNAVLRAAAAAHAELRLLEWDAMLADHPEWLAPDGLHGSPEGYAARAVEAARLVRECPPAPREPA